MLMQWGRICAFETSTAQSRRKASERASEKKAPDCSEASDRIEKTYCGCLGCGWPVASVL
jgi:hypothetical protein